MAEGILDAFSHAALVCLGETHGSTRNAALREALVAHPRFAGTVDVVLLELANPIHQSLLDRLTLDGQDVPREELRAVWRDAGGGTMWELPMYESLLRDIAGINAALPRERRVRVVGGAVPIDWQRVRTAEDLAPFARPDRFYVEVARREVLTPGLHGLALYGTGHCERSGPGFLATLAIQEPERVWSVVGFEGPQGVLAARRTLALGDRPALVAVAGSSLASQPTGAMLFEGHGLADRTLGDVTDAIVYYGAGDDLLLDPDPAALEPAFTAELTRRARLRAAALAGSG